MAGRTPLGPLSLSLAVTSDSEWQLMLGLGRPIEERAITDPAGDGRAAPCRGSQRT